MREEEATVNGGLGDRIAIKGAVRDLKVRGGVRGVEGGLLIVLINR